MVCHVPKLFPDGFTPLGLLLRIFVIISTIKGGGLDKMMPEAVLKI